MKLSIRFSHTVGMYTSLVPVLCVDDKAAAYVDEIELGMPSAGGPNLVVTKMRVYRVQEIDVQMVDIPSHPAIEVVADAKPLAL